ncbi:starch branching enzyme [Coccomyxa subellipsoidea C-169]|uniref:1,4-alpha-glucan branching enzyme n=1 Tax=Coccomyxa subellipsoidea (strain C-169) TaxID=574566 RepID=I0Z451_COCSC|nr:starch branching enzyme [Coccomyxa subellipsoidea C-169]EIE25420.1 starch branching enzyme [Coccomyxa subellipsoidea C-169]|eukprot:XP_005649964.1 starch branching enzyme [Coccomyxa subellipsoidea C-169]
MRAINAETARLGLSRPVHGDLNIRKVQIPITRHCQTRKSERQRKFAILTITRASDTALEVEAGYSKDGMDIAQLDEDLLDHEEHLKYRYNQFLQTKASLEKAEGSLANFAKGYEKMGFFREGNATVYREWCPAASSAQLIGDFNAWGGSWMERDAYGVWKITLPDDPQGKPAIAHGSRVKIRLQHPGGWFVDRVPAWIRWATVEPNKMGAKYDGIFWDPPAQERHAWQHERPKDKPAALRIYEAHVGMSSEAPEVASYTYFKDNVLPRIAKLGYNAIQLMAVQEHAYYASFGYHVTSPFAVSSRSGTPEELKALIDEAHRLGLLVLLDVVHSHVSSNADDGIAGYDLGQGEEGNYFCSGERGYHTVWDSRLFNYRNWEVLRYLLSNLRWWLEEYRFDGFRFDGVTSMLYWHHGINMSFSGDYKEYFSPATNVDAVVYLMLANVLVHELLPQAITVAEDVSGMPALGRPVSEGGCGFDYRLGMGIPDQWMRLVKDVRDENWSMTGLVSSLCNRRYTERTVAYVESHDQSLVGDQTLAFRLMGAEMYTGMSALQAETPGVARGMALHKIIRALTLALGGEGWLSFMGNEFGHPDWIDFPRDGNGWSYDYCRRQWSLVDAEHLRYKYLNAWDGALQGLDSQHNFLSSTHQLVSYADDAEQVIVAERGPLLFVFNFSPFNSYEGYKVGTPEPGRYKAVLTSDDVEFGGRGRINHDTEHFTHPEGTPGAPETNFNDRAFSMLVASPSRTVAVYALMPEDPHESPA